ncbi:hypothetical protein [Paludibacterium purpuratum]|uniref:Uncharacterized protein n=1 Tax=Paludibacterium purpuratum TaxID=1144873 RepID=A0A4R7B9F9_9NEIS|nr:hypothetical protein [Paludibacterium purpuratum]TDR81530.1 hypothetical protein DFP86_103183 [Paludibacterium purpuratum]
MKIGVKPLAAGLGLVVVAASAAILMPLQWQTRQWHHGGHRIALLATARDTPPLVELIDRQLDRTAGLTSLSSMSALYAQARTLHLSNALITIDDVALAMGDKRGQPWRLDIPSQMGSAMLGNMPLYDGELAQTAAMPRTARQIVLIQYFADRAKPELAPLSALTGGKADNGSAMQRLHQGIRRPLLVETQQGDIWVSPGMMQRMHWYHPQQRYSMMQATCHMNPAKS